MADPNPAGHLFALQTAPSTRSRCYNCEEPIQLGSVRFGAWSPHDEREWLNIWRFRHPDCVTSSEINQALAEYETVEGIPTLIKQGLGSIPPERREECNMILSCTLNGEPKPEEVVRRLNANPDQHVWDLLEDAKSRRIRTPGSKKQDKFDAAKAAIESARDAATGQFDVNEALAILTSKKTKIIKPRAKIKGKAKGKEENKTKKTAPKRKKAEITDSPVDASDAEELVPRSKRPKAKKPNKAKARKADKKGKSTKGWGSRPSRQAGGGSAKEEEKEATAVVNLAAAPGSAFAGATASTPSAASAAAATDITAETLSSSGSGVADSGYAGPRTRSRSKRSRS